MSNNLNLWNNLKEVNVIQFPDENVVKFTNIDECLYILTSKHNLYYGNLETQGAEPFIQFKKSSFLCLDIDACTENVYIVDVSGCTYKCNKELTILEEILLISEENEVCCHGVPKKYKLKVKSIAVNDLGGLLLTNNDQLWAFGYMPQINITNSVPKKVEFFSGRKVFDISIGKDFAVVIVGAHELENDLLEYNLININCSVCNDDGFQDVTQSIVQEKTFEENIEAEGSSNSSCCSLGDKKTLETFEILKPNNNVNKNVFYNTEAAKDFLKKQFSWISTNSEDSSNTEVQTNALRENVTNVASLVYEKVKSVGDKVAILSKHLSNETENIECNLDNTNEWLLTSADDVSSSVSIITLETMSEIEVKENYGQVLKEGAEIINREVWTWGNINHGQLGTGDNIKREHPMIISKLSKIGAIKCSVRSFHIAAITLDGRAFLWGKNDQNQISFESNSDQSSPKIFSVPANERILDASCGQYHTNLLTTNGDLYYLGSHQKNVGKPAVIHSESLYRDIIDNLITFEDIELIPVNEKGISNGKLFSSSNLTLLDKYYEKRDVNSVIVEESSFLENLLIIYLTVIKQIQKKYFLYTEEDIYEKLSSVYLELIYLIANNLSSIIKYSYGEIPNSETIIIKHNEEFIGIYKNYFNLINDIVSIDGLQLLAKFIDVPQVVYKTSVVNSLKNKGKINNLNLIKVLLKYPKNRFIIYEEIVHKLLSAEKNHMEMKIINKLTSIYEEEKDNENKAEMTNHFWNQSGKLMDYLKKPHRKLIIESHKNPISLQGGSRFSSHWFILLSDIFVYINGSIVLSFDLKILWVEAVQDENETEHKIILKTPEDHFVLVAYELEEKSKWLQSLQNAVKVALKKINSINVPNVRNADFTFTKPGFFKNAKYSGRWSDAKMQGKGGVEWTDGRKYFGQFNNNTISGFGKMEIPNTGACTLFKYIGF